MIRGFLATTLAVIFFMLPACKQQPPGNATNEPAAKTTATDAAATVRVGGWDGINNLFREGDLYFGGQPDSVSLVRLAQELGMGTVITLRSPEEDAATPFDEVALIEELGMDFIRIPVDPVTVSPAEVAYLKDALDEAEGPVLVYCGSSNRVGGLWAAHLATNEGLTVEEALERGRAAGLRTPSMTEAVHRILAETDR